MRKKSLTLHMMKAHGHPKPHAVSPLLLLTVGTRSFSKYAKCTVAEMCYSVPSVLRPS